MATLTQAHRGRPGARRALPAAVAVAAVVVVIVVVMAGVLAPVWGRVLLGLAAAVVGAVWATRPPEVSLARHLAVLAGQVVLDVVRTVLRAVVALAVTVALLAAGWSWITPHPTGLLEHATSRATHQITGELADQTPDTGDLARLWDRLTGETR